MEVHKFGGTCTASREAIDRIVEIILLEQKPLIVTVSAASGVTRFLIDTLNKPIQEIFVPSIISQLQHIHQELRYNSEPLNNFDNDLHKLERLLYGIIYTEEITERSRDLVLTFGERLISWIVKERLANKGILCKCVDPIDLLLTDGTHHNSRILLEETEDECQNYDFSTDVIIVPGFYGISKSHITTTLGRSGTDYTATALGYGFNASAVTIWKDVQGFMTADPQLVNSAKTIASLSYDEAAELSHFGAIVLHPKCVIPVKLKKIPLWIKNFYDPSIRTKVWTESHKDTTVVKSVSHLSDLSIIRVFISSGGYTHGILSKLSSTLDQAGTNIYSIASSQTSISFLVNSNEISKNVDLVKTSCSDITEAIEIESDIALICMVGSGMGNTHGIAAKVFQAVAQQNVNVAMISSGASKAAFNFTVHMNDLGKALTAIHDEFFS